MKKLHMLAFTLLVIGGINWGLVGFFDYNFVESIGLPSGLVTVVYALVGLSAVWEGFTHKQNCRHCGTGGM